MAEELILHQVKYSRCTYDNGILIIEKRTGGTIRHKKVPWSVFNGLKTTGNADSYYESHVKNHYPIF